MTYQLKTEELKAIVERAIFGEQGQQTAGENLKQLSAYLNEDSKADLYTICCELEAKYIEKLTALEKSHATANLATRKRLKTAIDFIKERLVISTHLSEITQNTSDHSIRGAIHYLNKFSKN